MMKQINLIAALCFLLYLTNGPMVEAAQGCPFDDGPCQEYCGQQGCNVGYCGHFAWIQCICRKCGDEWSWYDKVHYNPDKTVNQTELDSLKLNGTTPLIVTNSVASQSVATSGSSPTSVGGTGSSSKVGEPQAKQKQAKVATLTTLLIPDLSDSSKLGDLNDIPDENSEKFLDFLAKNHEKLVQATTNRAQQMLPPQQQSQQQQQQQQQQQLQDDLAEDEEQQQANGGATSSQSGPSDDEELVEIQISSSNNNSNMEASLNSSSSTSSAPATTTLATSTTTMSTLEGSEATSGELQPQRRDAPFALFERLKDVLDVS